jgi:hypothetical protein
VALLLVVKRARIIEVGLRGRAERGFKVAGVIGAVVLVNRRINQVFSPEIRTQLKGAVDAACQAGSESSGISSAAPRNRVSSDGTRGSAGSWRCRSNPCASEVSSVACRKLASRVRARSC